MLKGKALFCPSMTLPFAQKRSIKTWFDEIDMAEIEWHAQSPELNIIGHVWDELEHWVLAKALKCGAQSFTYFHDEKIAVLTMRMGLNDMIQSLR